MSDIFAVRKPTTSPSTVPSGRASASQRPVASLGAMAEQCPVPRCGWWKNGGFTDGKYGKYGGLMNKYGGCNHETKRFNLMNNGFGWIWMDSDLSVAAILMQNMMINPYFQTNTKSGEVGRAFILDAWN